MNSIERSEIFDLAYRFVTETSENIFLTGKAGTGKTTFLKYLKENCSKNIVVAAPTGVAAINAGGVTLHSLFQLPFHPFLPTKNNKDELLAKIRFNRQRQQLLRKVELLVIDEISMVRCDTMDAIDTILKSVRRKYDVPFGGLQLLCIGDLHQLPPVARRHEWNILQEYYSSEFFFDSNVIKEQMPLLIELNKIYRQKEFSFVELLNKVRNNYMNADDFEDLHQRYNPSFRPTIEEKYITLTSHNNQADQINARELQKLLSPSYKYEAIIEDDFPENNYPAEGSLILKEGAQVMFLKNDTILKRYFNGKIGVVKKLSKDEIQVECDGATISVSMETWENSRYVLNREDGKLQQETLGTFTQFPLRLAWAITIHKSQGLTFEKVMIDAGAAFSSGQVYVALSRCTNLNGIVLLSRIPPAAIYSNNNVIKGQQALTHKGSLAERFDGARQIFTQQLLEEIFSFNEIATL
ncbi:MAG: ATP-dependent DNA helicase, partial [Ginsengibacter sp.]